MKNQIAKTKYGEKSIIVFIFNAMLVALVSIVFKTSENELHDRISWSFLNEMNLLGTIQLYILTL